MKAGVISMANEGWHGTQEEWGRIERPLLELDPVIDDFAKRARLAVTKNLKDWPERSLRWREYRLSNSDLSSGRQRADVECLDLLHE